MFDFVAKHKRLLQLVLIALIVPPFAFFGIQSFDWTGSGGTDLADVDGGRVTAREFALAQDQRREQLREMLGRNFDPTLLDAPEARRQLLDALVAQRVLGLYMARNRMLVTDEQVRETIAGHPAFQEDGQFARQRYQAFIQAQAKSEEQFEADLRRDLALRQLATGLAESTIVAKASARRLAAIRGESREVADAMLPASQFLGQVKLAPDAVEAYYKANPQAFEVPEQVRAEYVQLSLDAFLAEETVNPEEVKAAYEASLAPQRAAHLEGRKKAEAVLAEVRKDPARFAEVAKAQSQDSGSAAAGGDLGWFGRGAMVKPFEDAVFRLKADEVSPLVVSEFGLHIIQLTGVRKAEGGKGEERRARHILINAPPEVKDFAAARADIERDLKRQRAQKRFPEAAEALSTLAYEQPDSLQPIAERFKLKVGTTGWFARATAPAPLRNAKLSAALFGDDAVRNRRNTEAVEVEPGRIVVARVLEHRPAEVRPLDEVRAEIVKRLTADEALRLAREAGEAKLRQLESGQDAGLAWGPARTVTRDAAGGLDRRAVAPVFRPDAAKLPAYVGVDLAPAGFGIFRVSQVTATPAVDEARLRATEAALVRQEANATYEAFVAGLRSRAKITVYEGNLQKKGDR
jgi:peptidyl-prolyl cis-trans isomerase D